MILAAGLWAFVIGYSLVYTGVDWFIASDKSKAITLAQALGIGSLTSPPVTNTKPTPNTTTSSTVQTQTGASSTLV